jgi:hypothetical protein
MMPLNPFHQLSRHGPTRPFIQEKCDARVVAGWGQTEVSGFATLIDYPAMLAAPSAIALTYFGPSLQNKGSSNHERN